MRILIACDKFRGSLTGQEVAQNLEQGLRTELPHASFEKVELADGGEGTMELLAKIHSAREVKIEVNDALGRQKPKRYFYNEKSQNAILEMAEYVGLAELDESERNPMITSSFGFGEAISLAVRNGARKLILGIGGSSTNDGGTGILKALGYRFLNREGQELDPVGGNLNHIVELIEPEESILSELEILIASDVDNPLCGANGAAYTYGKQKGASIEEQRLLDDNLKSYGTLIQDITATNVFEKPGYGAAGGVALSLCELLGASLQSGSNLVFEANGLEEKITNTDIVITGEGKIDRQSAHGKAIAPIVEFARSKNKELYLVCGVYEQTGSPKIDLLPRFELIKLAEQFSLDSFKDAAKLAKKAGGLIAERLE